MLELPKLFSWSLLAEAGWRFSFEAGGYSPLECPMLRLKAQSKLMAAVV